MVKRKIIWSNQAQIDRIGILNYWAERTYSKEYSIKLNRILINSIELISKMPEIGIRHTRTKTRIKIIKHYYIVYLFDENELKIISIWDSRQDPKTLRKKLE